MASDLDNLLTRRSTLLAELAAIGPGTSGGKPTYSIDGQSVDHTAYRMSLYQELELLERQIATRNGPFEVVDRAST